MKKKTLIAAVSAAFSIVFLGSCFFQVPETISLRTNANYSLGIGKINESFDNKFSINEIIGSAIQSNSRIKVYDYNPDGKSENVQQYLIKMPIQEIPVDFSKYFEGSKIFDQIEGLSFSKELVIPKIDYENKSSFNLNGLNAALNAAASFGGAVAERGVVFSSGSSFSKLEYSSGTLEITNPSKNITGTVNLCLYGASVASGKFENGVARLSLRGVTLIPGATTIEFSDVTPGKVYTAVISSGSELNKAEGVFMSDVVVPISSSFDSGLKAAGVEECVVSTGNISIVIEFPLSWTNTVLTYGVTLSGALDAVSDVSIYGKNINLAGKLIKSGEINLVADLHMTVTNGTIDFSKKPSALISTQISDFSRILMKLDNVNSTLNQKEDLASEVREFIKSITLKESGLTGKYTNGLPAGNNITIAAKSEFLGLDDSSVMTAGTTDGQLNVLSSDSPKTVNLKHPATGIGDYTAIDFTIDILFPGATKTNPNVCSLNNVSAGQKYTISLDLSSKVDWTKIVMYPSGSNQTGVIPTGLGLSSMFTSFDETAGSDFGKKATLASLPVYLYFEKPDIPAFDNAVFRGGHLECYIGKNEGGRVIKIDNGKDQKFLQNGEVLNFSVFPKIKQKKDTVTVNLANESYSATKDIADLLNSSSGKSGETMYLDYSLQFSSGKADEFTITREDFNQTSNGSSSIAIYAALVMPLQFNLSDAININLLGLSGQTGDSDLLGRTEPSSQTEMVDFLSTVQYAGIMYKTEKLPFASSKEISLRMSFSNDEEDNSNYEVLDISEGIIQINPVELMETYPLVPKAYIVIPKAKFSIRREMVFDTTLALSLVTNGTIRLWGGK